MEYTDVAIALQRVNDYVEAGKHNFPNWLNEKKDNQGSGGKVQYDVKELRLLDRYTRCMNDLNIILDDIYSISTNSRKTLLVEIYFNSMPSKEFVRKYGYCTEKSFYVLKERSIKTLFEVMKRRGGYDYENNFFFINERWNR